MVVPRGLDGRAPGPAGALRINTLYVRNLGRFAQERGLRVLHVTTDCVFSGRRGRCTERDPHDAVDACGKAKSLGEARWATIRHLRCSFVDPEPKEHKHLLLLRAMACAFGRGDLQVRDVESPLAVDRTPATEHADFNARLWRSAGYPRPPTMPEMVDELARLHPRIARLDAEETP